MNIVLLQVPFSQLQIEALLKEFPQFLFLSYSELSYKTLSKNDWPKVEIIFGSRLTSEELSLATHLRWIHTPTAYLGNLCFDEIDRRENILVTVAKEENVTQISEFVMAAILAYSKNLFHWGDVDHYPTLLWDSKWRDQMWKLSGRLLLQIGIDRTAIEIANIAQKMGLRVYGVQEEPTFHPYFQKMISMKELYSYLPEADIISLRLPRSKSYEKWLGIRELNLMKEDSILVILGSHKIIQEEAVFEVAQEGKFRGILLDTLYQNPIPANSLLWKIPNILITPEVAPRPKSKQKESLRDFRYNMRQYVNSNFIDMRNLIDTADIL